MKRTALAFSVTVLATIASTGAALAVDAVVTRDSVIYQSRTSNVVVNEVEEGDIVDVRECASNRCRLRGIPGPDGWIRQSRLAPLDEEGDPQPGIQFQFNLGPGGPGLSIGIGSGGSSITIGSGGPTSGPRVCLYEHVNYGGARRCIAAGDTINNLSSIGWNDVASSARTYGGAEAQICEHAGGGGACHLITTNVSNFGGFSDKASYIDVY